MLYEHELESRCDNHVGEPFRTRCAECDDRTRGTLITRPGRYVPGSNCPKHDGYPLPCDRCNRDALSMTTLEMTY